MCSTTPTISILLPAYNAEPYLEEALTSMLAQTFDDFELLVLDDGSTDKSASIVYRYALNDSRIRYIRNEQNLGLIATLNKGLALARGRYIARMDADDISPPERFAMQLDYLQKHMEVAVVGSNGKYLGNMSGPIRRPLSADAIAVRLLFDNPILHSAVMIRRSWLEAHHIRYREDQLYAEDYDFWVQIVEAGGRVVNLPEELLYYRIHSQSTTQSKQQIQERTSGAIRRRQLAKLGCTFSADEIEVLDTFMFRGSYCPKPDDLRLLRQIFAKLSAVPLPLAKTDRMYELGRFMAALFPRPKSFLDKARLAIALSKVNLQMAVVFLPLFLKGKP